MLQEARNERVVTPLSIDQALDARDAFAKALYNALFSWLVSRINQIVYKGTKRTAVISILDIFGFEDFKVKSVCCCEEIFYFNKINYIFVKQLYVQKPGN
jgi:myosin-15